MSVRQSGFDRVPADLYQSPPWLIDALAEHVSLNGLVVWEPACGQGRMVRALEAAGAFVHATDLQDHGFPDMAEQMDFTAAISPVIPRHHFTAIITNPPYGPQGRTAAAFIRCGLALLPPGGLLALLLPVDFDSAKTRAPLFGGCPDFAAKIVLRRRIAWFEPQPGQAGPSANHAWFVWERSHLRRGAAVTLYAPSNPVAKINTDEREAA
jgi:hypothetical protein